MLTPKNQNDTHSLDKDVEVLRSDVKRLKEDAVTTASHIGDAGGHLKEEGVRRARTYADRAQDRAQDLRDRGEQRLRTMEERIEDHVRDKPHQSVAIAFAAGMIASIFLGRRR